MSIDTIDKKKNDNICFVSFLDQDNLGVGYIASSLLQSGHFDITLIDIKEPVDVIVKSIIEARPLIVGFSIVFQGQLDTFQKLTGILRANRIKCHFTAGGHYPSLRYEELMTLIPELDSVVLFEGEHTIVELAEAIRKDFKWQGIDGIAYRTNGTIYRNALRPLETDLDSFPLPVRRTIRPTILGQKVINLLAGRGCYYKCSFCSIHRFYSQSPGKAKRIRRPEFVAREMQLHYEQEGCTIFLFQDDDFPILARNGHGWIDEFCHQLHKRNLVDHIMWKISCRVDEVDEEKILKLMAHGLSMVYLGIESGTIEGLNSMNKRITPKDSLTAVGILKKLELPFEFGFMMFDPFTTFDSLQKNVAFLFQLCGDGSASAGLAKMLALAGTEIEDTLRSHNRLCGRPPFEDYRFFDPRLDECFKVLLRIFDAWMHDETGFMNFSRWVHLQLEAFRRFYMDKNEAAKAAKVLQQTVSSANQYLLNTVISVANLVRSQSDLGDAYSELETITTAKHKELCTQLTELSTLIDNLAFVR
jgi:anaerobic magnesium-protoporphyrin IX monomethyl ester cyclase